MLNHEKIHRLRTHLKITMEEAASRAGLSGRQQWYLIESGRRADITLSTLDKLARALGVKARDLLK